MRRGQPDDRDLARFFPRVTLAIAAGLLLFLVSAGLYALPVLLEPPPPGAIADYHKEKVRARLQGKVIWFLAGSLFTVTLVFALPRGGGPRKS
jgi:hypothetical protein